MGNGGRRRATNSVIALLPEPRPFDHPCQPLGAHLHIDGGRFVDTAGSLVVSHFLFLRPICISVESITGGFSYLLPKFVFELPIYFFCRIDTPTAMEAGDEYLANAVTAQLISKWPRVIGVTSYVNECPLQ